MAAGQSSATAGASSARSTPPPTGLQVIHANRLEDLRALTVEVVRRFPLAPLEREVFLVHSNGIAQWLKLALARDDDDPELAGLGIAAGMSFLLPSRFLWQVYRDALGESAVARQSPYDKERLTWRLMRLLPEICHESVFAPLERFLAGEQADRRLYQLAERVADLFDQYQVYRADWLDDWRQGRDVITVRGQAAQAIPEAQRWQPELWRRLEQDIGAGPDQASRAAIHTRFMAQTGELSAANRPAALPRRVIVFGVSSLPQQTLEVLSRLGQCAQVLLCVHNPCQFYWADIVEDRELLRAVNRRGRVRDGMPASLDDGNLHLHAQPLLAAWGKQGRDYIRLLDHYDDQTIYRHWFDRIDLFESPRPAQGPATLLQSLQDDILSLRPVADACVPQGPEADDDSLVFHTAHSPQREVEILHDQLLAAFSADPELTPQDVIVMVPDINSYAPHIQAVFGQIDADDERYIPFTISDQGQRHRVPVLVALEKLLALPESRLAVSDLLDLLEVPAVRARFGLTAADLPQLHDWIQGANIRWGLNAEQRQALDLPDGLSQNTWWFGIRRMLLGYALGDAGPWRDIEPYDEVGGLESRLAGQLEAVVRQLEVYWRQLSERRVPAEWARMLSELRADFFADLEDDGSLVFSRLEQVVADWLLACEDAGLADTTLPLAVVREVWLEGLEQGGLSQRFLAGKVNFATLMPMRAIPFQRICLLGMNDGDYPRSQPPMDFDLMAGDYRPGDRSRREDDRYLFLEALLSARKQHYISWVGRNINDNSERPPSVLVAQLQDHLNAIRPTVGDGPAIAERLTLEHPLQPFSRAYFDGDGHDGLFTYAREWRQTLDGETSDASDALAELPEDFLREPLALADLARLLKRPVEIFLQQRLGVRFDELGMTSEDDEPFVLDGLGHWALTDELVQQVVARTEPEADLDSHLRAHTARQARRGDLAQGGLGELQRLRLTQDLDTLAGRYHAHCQQFGELLDLQRLSLELEQGPHRVMLEDWLAGLRRSSDGALARIELISSNLTTSGNRYNWPHCLAPWVQHLAANSLGHGPMTSFLLSKAGDVTLRPVPPEEARTLLQELMSAWLEALAQPLPLAPKTAFAWLSWAEAGEPDKALRDARSAYEGGYEITGERDQSPALGRAFADFDSLWADGGLKQWAERLYLPLWRNVKQVEPEEGGDD
ncbi:MAG: exodeoxyribonuclease V subunit gamma [Marinobacter sp.]|uniref:exodeoxyribonuclease V subunit gamma n=1 Tax=Marinobacter sp. TaxID=50741 RepID=UPI00299F2070|nr:exodeoxyribonuclease V subunit gamma [Marinobacter sp.]MDX1634573.1 exodeoxyribonuclease V subunit gamma [Marinobacter sp.]